MFFWISDIALGTTPSDPERIRGAGKPARRRKANIAKLFWHRMSARVSAWVDRRRTLEQLEALSPHLHADAGLTPGDLEDMRHGIYRPRPLGPGFRAPVLEAKPVPEPEHWRDAA